MSDRSEAHAFLISLENRLRSGLCAPSEMRSRIAKLTAAIDSTKKPPEQREAAFLTKLVAPLLFEHMQTVPGIGKSEARQSLVADYKNVMSEYCSENAARPKPHPFEKRFGATAPEIMARWKGQSKSGKNTLKGTWPDFAFRGPFPHKIVFEGKYFPGGNAEQVLVEAVYEACFYRGLPFVPAAPPKPAWDYDFACVIAYDASENGSVKAAWDCVIPKAEFWENANVYVMVLGGDTINSKPAIASGLSIPVEMVTEVPAVDTFKQEVVTIDLLGARETFKYIVTPPLAGRERWFDKKSILSYNPHPDGGFVVTLAKRELATRGLLFLITAKE
jgi:hypothetical protein